MSEDKYIYEKSDRALLDSHIKKQKENPVYFQISFREVGYIAFIDEMVTKINEGKSAEDLRKDYLHRRHCILDS